MYTTEMRLSIILCAVALIGLSGCSGMSSSNSNTPTPSDTSEYNLSKLSPELNKSTESLDESESIVVSITVEEGLSEREFNRTVSTVQSQTVAFRSAFKDDRLITARATTEQTRNLTTLNRVVMIDLVETGAPSS